MKLSKIPVVLFVLIVGAVAFFYSNKEADPPSQQPMEPITIPFQEFEVPQAQYAVPDIEAYTSKAKPKTQEPATDPLPSLSDSDAALKRSLPAMIKTPNFAENLMLKDVITRFVITVDNLTARTLPEKYRLIKKPRGEFKVLGNREGKLELDPANEGRYDFYIKAVQTINTQALLLTYVRYYPLFQQVYEELGYFDRYFNNRLVEVIGHLLETPEVGYPVPLKQPKVFYEFANARYEKLSAGQKMLIRMGPAHRTQVKSFLTELRKQLMALGELTAVKQRSVK